ncbi:MAG: LamG domain-containing protein, partial [Bacteroidia bacterium]|nr:LamG domain-containing protein [Bacteroidia bacterium]
AAWYGFQFEVLGGSWDALTKGVKLATRYQLASTTDAEDTWWNGNPNGWQGSLLSKDVTAAGGLAAIFKDKWAHVVCAYDATTKVGTMFVNGEKTREWDFDLWPDDSPKKAATGVKFAGNTTDGGNNLAIGFIQASGNRIVSDGWADPSNPDNNHFKGLLDDIRIFSRSLTTTEVSLMYNSEKP